MAFNGSGVYTLPTNSFAQAVTGTTISSSGWNATGADLATALTTALCKDGQSTTTARIPFAQGASMGSQTITAVADGTAVTHAATVGQIQSSAAKLIGSVAGTNTITGVLTPVLTAYASGQQFILVPANTNTGATTLEIVSGSAKNVFAGGAACVGGELVANVPSLLEYDGTQFNIVGSAPFRDSRPLVVGSADATKKVRFEVDGNTASTTRVMTVQNQDHRIGSVALGYINGLTLSTAGSSATMTIAAGQATDSTGVMMMTLASAINKTTSAWAVGDAQGGLDTGVIANNTWYKFFEIMRPDTGVVDVIFTTAALATGPTMPANYTLFRYIGSGRTNGSAQWVSFVQDGDFFQWASPVLDVDATNPGTTAVSATLTIPTGLSVLTWTNVGAVGGAATNQVVYLSDLATTDVAPSLSASPLASVGTTSTNSAVYSQVQVRSNTASAIRYRARTSGGGEIVRITTLGWVDPRGKNL